MRRFHHVARLHVRPPAGGRLELIVAEHALIRLLGLALLESLEHRVGLLIPSCRSIHTLGMRFRIDVVFVTPAVRGLVVGSVSEAVPPRRIIRSRGSGLGVIEVPSGEARRLGLQPGARLVR